MPYANFCPFVLRFTDSIYLSPSTDWLVIETQRRCDSTVNLFGLDIPIYERDEEVVVYYQDEKAVPITNLNQYHTIFVPRDIASLLRKEHLYCSVYVPLIVGKDHTVTAVSRF